MLSTLPVVLVLCRIVLFRRTRGKALSLFVMDRMVRTVPITNFMWRGGGIEDNVAERRRVEGEVRGANNCNNDEDFWRETETHDVKIVTS